MKHINDLIQELSASLPFNLESQAQNYLSTLDIDDQCAIISALYIGRSHMGHNEIMPDFFVIPFDRYHQTGNSPNWTILPQDFPRILHEKSASITRYLRDFEQCCRSSKIDLSKF